MDLPKHNGGRDPAHPLPALRYRMPTEVFLLLVQVGEADLADEVLNVASGRCYTRTLPQGDESLGRILAVQPHPPLRRPVHLRPAHAAERELGQQAPATAPFQQQPSQAIERLRATYLERLAHHRPPRVTPHIRHFRS